MEGKWFKRPRQYGHNFLFQMICHHQTDLRDALNICVIHVVDDLNDQRIMFGSGTHN